MFGFVYIGSKTIYSLRNYVFLFFLVFFVCLLFFCVALFFFIISNKNIKKNTGGANGSRDSLVDPASTHAPGEGAEMEVLQRAQAVSQPKPACQDTRAWEHGRL